MSSDGSLSLIDIKQRQRGHPPSGVGLGDVGWRALPESLGVRARAAATDDECERAFAQSLERPGPSLIDVRIDPGNYAATTMTAVRE